MALPFQCYEYRALFSLSLSLHRSSSACCTVTGLYAFVVCSRQKCEKFQWKWLRWNVNSCHTIVKILLHFMQFYVRENQITESEKKRNRTRNTQLLQRVFLLFFLLFPTLFCCRSLALTLSLDPKLELRTHWRQNKYNAITFSCVLFYVCISNLLFRSCLCKQCYTC